MRGEVQKSFGRRLAPASVVAVALLLLGIARWASAQSQKNPPVPYASIASEGESYAGPGRESAYDLTGPVLHIGLLAPLHGPQKPEGDAMVAGAQMALRDALAQPLPGERRVVLAIQDESGPSWGLVSDAVIHLILDDNAVAVITSANGADAHLSEQVGNRIGVPILTLSADATTTQIDIPWIFRMGPSDALEAKTLARRIYRERGLKQVFLITEQDHDGRRGSEAMEQAVRSLGGPPQDSVALDPLHPDFASVLARIETQSPQAIVLWTRAATTGVLLRSLRAARISVPCYLQAGFGMDFGPADGSSGSERIAPSNWNLATDGNDAAAQKSFAQRYRLSTGMLPSPAATETYDAVLLTVRALRAAGPNRARVRDQLASVRNFAGASGTISFDREGNNTTALHMVWQKEVWLKEREVLE